MTSTPTAQAGDPQVEMGNIHIHLGIAEQGKVYALAGNHKLALLYLRHAMHMTAEAGDPEVFFRHYLEAALESMERLGYYDDVLGYTDKAIALYSDADQTHALNKLDLATIHQKRGVILLKQQKPKVAAAAFQTAIDMMKEESRPLPLASALHRWAVGGLSIDNRRILAEQERHDYFSVRKETVDPSRAIKLPNEDMLQIL